MELVSQPSVLQGYIKGIMRIIHHKDEFHHKDDFFYFSKEKYQNLKRI